MKARFPSPLRTTLVYIVLALLVLWLSGELQALIPAPFSALRDAGLWADILLVIVTASGWYLFLRRAQQARVSADQRLLDSVTTAESVARAAAQEVITRERDVLYTIMENTGAQLAYLDPQFRFVHANSAYTKACGHRLEDLLGHNHFELFPNAENEAIFEQVRATRQAITFHAKPFTFADQPWRGTTYWDWSLVPLPDSTGGLQGLVFSLVDVTDTVRVVQERETLLEEVERQRRIVQTVVDHVPAGLVLLNRADFRVIWANPTYQRFLDPPFREGDITGLYLAEFIPKAQETGVVAAFEQVAQTGIPYSNPEFEYDGFARGMTYWQWSVVPVQKEGEQEGEQEGLLLVANEVTELVQARKKVEELALEARRRADELASLLDVSQDVVSTLDLEQILLRILGHLKPILDFSTGGVFVPQEGQLALLVYDKESLTGPLQWIYSPLEGAPMYDEAARRRAPVIIDDLQDETNPLARMLRHETSEAIRSTIESSRSWMGIPLLAKDHIVGLLRVTHPEPAHFTLDQAQIALAIANQAAVAVENAQLYRQAQKAAALEERQRLARELHDSISQALYGIALGSHAALEMVQKKPAQAEDALRFILSLAEAAVTEMRALIFELRPESLEREGLIGALERQAAAVKARYRVDLHSELGEEPVVPLEVKEALYRIAQEAMQNAGRHANASQIDLRLCEEPHSISLEVKDDGKGFDPNRTYPAHLGLQSMRERAARVNGNLTIRSAAGQGTVVRLVVGR